MKRLMKGLFGLMGMLLASSVQAEQPPWLLQTSLYTTHQDPKPEHNNDQEMLLLQYAREDDWLVGGSTFRHSFGQRATYLYAGRAYDVYGPLYAKLTGGFLHGYRGEYKDKIPLNEFGVAPALIPSVGVNVGWFSSEIVILGTAALMVTGGVRF